MKHPLLSVILLAIAGCGGNATDPRPSDDPSTRDQVCRDEALGDACLLVDDGDDCPAAGEVDPDRLIIHGNDGCEIAEDGIDTSQPTPAVTPLDCHWRYLEVRDEPNGCCYTVTVVEDPNFECPVIGPPYRHNGASVTAAADDGVACDLTGPAAAWWQIALGEHASIATFAKLQIQLLAHGAPPVLLAQCATALADEVRHTQLALQIATDLAGRPLVIGDFPFDAPIDARPSLAQLAADALREGCIGETLSALATRRAAERATNPHHRATLFAIAADEDRHAAFSWALVAWALAAGGSKVRAAVLDAVHTPHKAVHLGLLDQADLADVTHSGVRGVIEPALVALLAA